MHSEHETIGILIPAYNDTSLLKVFFKSLSTELPSLTHSFERACKFEVIVIDDGSVVSIQASELTPHIKENFDSVSFSLLRHDLNLGQGAALRTGIEFGMNVKNCSGFITMDSDGQHRIEDLPAILNPVLNGSVDITFGNRFKGELSPNMPKSRKTILKAAVLFERVVTGLPLKDAHNGYRAFNYKAAHALKIEQNRMAHATEIKQIVAKEKLRFREVPVSIIYSAETLSKGQSNMGSFAILKDLMKAYLFGG